MIVINPKPITPARQMYLKALNNPFSFFFMLFVSFLL
jgi:hypothetical protein